MIHFPLWAWTTLFILGAYHGLNPAMGWLFAVALGLQQNDAKAVWRSLLPIVAGHLVAVGLVVAVALVAGTVLPLLAVRIGVAVLLIGFGVYRLSGKGHPRWGGMKVGFLGLAFWSFLMASAHGAGFMLLPVLLKMSGTQAMHMEHAPHVHAMPGGEQHGPQLRFTRAAISWRWERLRGSFMRSSAFLCYGRPGSTLIASEPLH